ncbi:hypothetical protein [Micromonospora sp. U21]|uniref:hypothetical protein n=1 Tax=Micromonospora sp. U21 TaxID=2824899 RepID=UPI0027DDAE8B|nr:hypothetical protein [Micromonospora sp. U21]
MGSREIGYLFGQYKRITNRYESGVLTGKGLAYGGAQARREATGYGAVFFAEEMLRQSGDSLEGKRVVVSGSGNVAIYAVEKVHQLGGTVVACSDSDGYLLDEKGIDLELLRELKEERRGRLDDYLRHVPHAVAVADRTVWEVPCDLALPCAMQNEIGGAELVAGAPPRSTGCPATTWPGRTSTDSVGWPRRWWRTAWSERTDSRA